MSQRIECVKRTRRLIKRKWDEVFYAFIKANFLKVEGEFKEHAALMRWVFLRILVPLAVFYVLAGVMLFKVYMVGSLFLGSMFFVYSNFLPDLDSLMMPVKKGKRASRWLEKYSLLLFAPVFIYYAASGQANPIYSTTQKEFHSAKALAIYIVFLFAVGFLFWRNPLQHTVLPVFGGLGYATHLAVDRALLPR